MLVSCCGDERASNTKIELAEGQAPHDKGATDFAANEEELTTDMERETSNNSASFAQINSEPTVTMSTLRK